jgi:hypothetical protein
MCPLTVGASVHMLPKMEAATAWSLLTNKESQVSVVVGVGGGVHMPPKMEAATAWSLLTNKDSQVGVGVINVFSRFGPSVSVLRVHGILGWIRIWILLFSSLTFKMPAKN